VEVEGIGSSERIGNAIHLPLQIEILTVRRNPI